MDYTFYLNKQQCYKQRQAETSKKQHPDAELLTNRSKHKFMCVNEIIWLIEMNMKLIIKNRSHKYKA